MVAVIGETAIAIKETEVELEELVARGRPKERIDGNEKKKFKGKGVGPSSQQ